MILNLKYLESNSRFKVCFRFQFNFGSRFSEQITYFHIIHSGQVELGHGPCIACVSVEDLACCPSGTAHSHCETCDVEPANVIVGNDVIKPKTSVTSCYKRKPIRIVISCDKTVDMNN